MNDGEQVKALKAKTRVMLKPQTAACLLFCFLSSSISVGALSSAPPSVSLRFSKRLGFAAFSDISGAFPLIADVSSDVDRVEFYVNGR